MLPTPVRAVVLLGKESVGKTQLAASLAGAPSAASNFRGATVGCDSYRVDDWELIDTPGITAAASLLHWLGALQAASAAVEPAMAVFRLPSEAALAVVLASVRKDGILLLAEPDVAAGLSAVQLLTAVYLAGVLLPCLVTCLTIAREQGRAFALRLVGRQAVAAAGFSALLAWGGAWL